MCERVYASGVTRVWALGDDEIPTRPVLRHSAFFRHCGLAMAITETHLHCRLPGCGFAIFRWRCA